MVDLRGSLLVLLATVGAVRAAEFQVNQYTPNRQNRPTISHDPTGAFVVSWQSYGRDGSYYGVFGRRFYSSGTSLGAEFQVNQYTTSAQRDPAISHDSSGSFVVAWSSLDQDGSEYGVFARLFPAALVTTGPAPGGGSLVRRHQRN